MYKDIGKKIKFIAKIEFVVGVIISVIYAIISIFNAIGLASTFDFMFSLESANNTENVFSYIFGLSIGFLLILAIGCFLSWVSSAIIYGFGELIENSKKTVSLLQKDDPNEESKPDSIEEEAPKSEPFSSWNNFD